MTSELIPGVWVFPHSVADGKNAIIIGSSSALAVDACMHEEEGDAMAEFIRDQGREPDLLAVTHGHPDHILGSRAFRGGEVIAHVEHDRQVRTMVARHAKRVGRDPDEVLAELARPTVMFTDEYEVSLGDRDVVLFHTPGHTGDSVCVYLPEDRVLVGGDTIVTGIVAAFSDGNGLVLEQTLRRLADLDVDYLVPGHGPVVSGPAEIRSWIIWQADYLSQLHTLLEPLVASGAGEDDWLEATPYEVVVDGRFDASQQGMAQRHQNAVRDMARDLQGDSATR